LKVLLDGRSCVPGPSRRSTILSFTPASIKRAAPVCRKLCKLQPLPRRRFIAFSSCSAR